MSRISSQCARLARRAAVLATLCSTTILVLPAEAQRRPPAPATQTQPTPRAGSWEIGGGVMYVGGYDLGDATAELTRNTTSGALGFDLFATASRVENTWALNGRFGYYLSPRLAIEGGVRYGKPVYSVELSGDAEDAPDITAEEELDQYVFTGSVLWHFGPAASPRTRVVPFVFGGAGYLRELHEGQELVETGVEYHAGAGVKYWFGGARRRFGLRGDAGVSFRDGGFDPEEKVRPVLTAGASVVYLF
ncbi:MAG TPA: outer membrane beta-barrel protein [Vicinamibacterales bacterium]|nr:outer membrane beta-barrel protein [Vicinamibacterales bacterium]